jgi:hypothetical protein
LYVYITGEKSALCDQQRRHAIYFGSHTKPASDVSYFYDNVDRYDADPQNVLDEAWDILDTSIVVLVINKALH